jgi:prolyl oligopeptidase
MSGGFRLPSILALLLPVAAAFAADGSSSTNPSGTISPPKAKVEAVEDSIHGHKISDPYRWLEKSDSPESQQYVEEQLAYTRSLLDPLPGREQIEKRLLEMAAIGAIGTPQLAGHYYFYIRREGTQNQPVLLVREGLKGKDRALIDVNKMSSDGTVALDWW